MLPCLPSREKSVFVFARNFWRELMKNNTRVVTIQLLLIVCTIWNLCGRNSPWIWTCTFFGEKTFKGIGKYIKIKPSPKPIFFYLWFFTSDLKAAGKMSTNQGKKFSEKNKYLFLYTILSKIWKTRNSFVENSVWSNPCKIYASILFQKRCINGK